MTRRHKQVILFLVIAALVIAVDQATKSWTRHNLAVGESLPAEGVLRLTHVQNTGATFGLFANQSALLAITLIICLLLIWLAFRYFIPMGKAGTISLGLIFGGAVGNLLDRIRHGYVTDFFDVRLWGDFHWPAFNIADTALVTGVVVLVIFLIILMRMGKLET
jgi:signal peptidase II